MFRLKGTTASLLCPDKPAEEIYRKMENFVRTKYEIKRWVMDGPMPDPATLDDDEDDDNVVLPYPPPLTKTLLIN